MQGKYTRKWRCVFPHMDIPQPFVQQKTIPPPLNYLDSSAKYPLTTYICLEMLLDCQSCPMDPQLQYWTCRVSMKLGCANLFTLCIITILWAIIRLLISHKFRISSWGTSPVVHWLRFYLPMQETRVQSLPWEEPKSYKATNPEQHNCWVCALEPASCNYWSWST